MSQELSAMRTMAWERAKGELRSMLQTYYASVDKDKFWQFSTALDEFISKVEGDALHE